MNRFLNYQLLLTFIIFYLIPFFYLVYDKENVSFFYRGHIGSPYILIISILFFFITYFFSKIKRRKFSFTFLSFFFNNTLLKVFVIIYFLLSTYFFLNYGYQFRQTGEGLSSGGFILFFHLLLKNYFKVFVAINIIKFSINRKILLKKFYIVILLFSLILSISGSLDFFLILGTLILLINPNIFFLKMRFRDYVLSFSIPILVTFLGLINKIGFETGLRIFTFDNLNILIQFLLKRISTWSQSIENIRDAYIFDYTKSLEIINGIISNFISRLEIIFLGSSSGKPEVWSLSRENFLLLFQNNSSEITGSSPGIVASSLIFFPFFFIFLSLVYSNLLSRVESELKKNINLIGHLFFLFVVFYPILASPIDMINLLSPSFIFIIFLYSGLMKIRYASH